MNNNITINLPRPKEFIAIDVGANNGKSLFPHLDKNDLLKCWAFEPTPHLIDILTTESKKYGERYHVEPYALSDFDGSAKFNIQAHSDWGCSSLNTFDDNIKETWPGLNEFYNDYSIDVKVYRFDTWYKEHNFKWDRIDFFHCDAQGSDLKVLQGMGDLIHMIRMGEIECARNDTVKLYKENHTLDDTVEFLTHKGFTITNISYNDGFGNELNVMFKRE